MAKYKVRNGQNIYDIAIGLYGTIEGVFDLLIANPTLSMATPLTTGMELEYHEGFVVNSSIVEQLQQREIIPINGERNVYYKPIKQVLRGIIAIPNDAEIIEFDISGEGTILVDWDDNTPAESIVLTHERQAIEHYFNNNADARRVKLYGDFSVMELDTTQLGGGLYLTAPLTVDEFISHNNSTTLDSLLLFEGTYKVDLQNSMIDDLSPIYNMSLSQLNLLGVQFKNTKVLDDYLVNLKDNYENRRSCEIWLDTEPSERGYQAIHTIINEPEWNMPNKWIFHIKNQIYIAQ